MDIPGFYLMLQDYCAYCGDFEPEIEKINHLHFGEIEAHINIRCKNRRKCSSMARYMEERIKRAKRI